MNTAPTQWLLASQALRDNEWHSAISSWNGMPRSEPKRAEISEPKLRSLWRRFFAKQGDFVDKGEVTMHQSPVASNDQEFDG